jgi:hypothetical protein
MYRRYLRILKRVERDAKPYTDLALTPVGENELERLELYKSTRGAEAVVDKFRRRQALGV